MGKWTGAKARHRAPCRLTCSRPGSWTQVHHVTAWIDGGKTTFANLTLVCGHHHRTFAALGWVCRIRNGYPEWIPPAWLDPDRKPRTNIAHHTADLLDGLYQRIADQLGPNTLADPRRADREKADQQRADLVDADG